LKCHLLAQPAVEHREQEGIGQGRGFFDLLAVNTASATAMRPYRRLRRPGWQARARFRGDRGQNADLSLAAANAVDRYVQHHVGGLGAG
jgi:hypothetical protein